MTGANGLVGSRVQEVLRGSLSFIPLTSQDMDITDKDAVHACLKNLNADVVLHLAAYTNVDGAEAEQEKAYAVNATGTQHLLDVSLHLKKQFIYLSTDFVFDGMDKDITYTEKSSPHAISTYGKSKEQGEQYVRGNGMIVRIAYPYGQSPAPKKGFVRILYGLLEQGKELTMVTDSLFTPTFIDDVAQALQYLVLHYSPEIFHVVGSQTLSPYEAGQIIAEVGGFQRSLILPTTYAEYFAHKAQRPRYSRISSIHDLGVSLRSFEEGVHNMYSNPKQA